LGTGAVTLAGGQLNVRVDSDTGTATTAIVAADLATKTYALPNAVTVIGNTTINADRIGEVQIFPAASTSIVTPTVITLTQGTTAGLKIGQAVSGTGVGAAAVVTAITGATTFTVSVNSTATGSATVTAQSAYTNNIVTFPTLNIGGQTLITSSGNTYGVGFNAVNLSNTPTFQTNNDLNLTGITDNGGGQFVVKNGTAQLWISSAVANNYSGGTVINQGLLRFGTQLAENATAKAGTGLITINAQGAVRIANATNFNAGQQLQVNGFANSPAVVRILGTATISAAQVQSTITPTSSRGALLLEATYANALDLSLIGDGSFYLGTQGNISYTANTLNAGSGSVYRLGQSNAAASVLTLAPTTASSPVLSGANSLIVGSLAAGFNNGTGTVFLNANNTFSGGSTVARLSNLRFSTGVTQGFGGSGLTNAPLGTGAVDAFSTLTAEGTAGSFVNPNTLAVTNPVNIHPGAIIRLDNNTNLTVAVAGTGAASQITGLASTAGLSVGMTVISTTVGFPAGGATIVSIDSATDVTLSAAPPAGALAGLQFASNDRWSDTAPVPLNGAQFFVNGINTGISNETVGSLSFASGSNIRLLANGTNGQAVLTIGGANTFARVGTGTMVFNNGAAGRLGLAAASTSERVLVAGGVTNILDDAGAPVVISNGILPAYYVAGADNTFVTYDPTNGFTRAAYTAAALNLPAGRIAGTDIAQVTGNVTLADNPNIYALGVTAAATILNMPGQINTITLDGSGATAKTFGGIIAANAAIVINPNIKAGSSGQFELPIFVNGNTTTLNGDISATGITKFGLGLLAIGKDQSDLARGTGNGYGNGWTVNEGQLTPLTFGSLGNAVATNTVTLNGATVTGANSPITNASTLRLQLNQANTGIGYYSMGNLNVLDNGGISYDPQADDRTQALGSAAALSNVTVNSTGGLLLDAQFSLNTNRNRTVLLVGDLSLVGANAGLQVNVITSNQTSNVTTGTSSGISVASLNGSSDQRVDKWGNGVLYVRGASTFAGAVNIEQGAVQINNPLSLGLGVGSNVVTVRRFGTLDINTANFARTDVIFQAGSLLRLTTDQAIAGNGTFNLGGGTLQVANDQTTTTTQFNMTGGGSIEGYLRTDDLLQNGITNGTRAVYRTLGVGVSFNLNGNSFLGQNINQGINGLDNGVQPDVFNPLVNAANGVLLEIKGGIFGTGSLTKQGYDTVTLSSATSTYSGGTNVTQGLLRAGAANVLGTSDGTTAGTGNLSTSGAAAFDVNGFNQSIGKLTSPAATGTAVAGYVTNTATTLNTLSTGNSVAAGNDFTYSGVIQNNVSLAKQGGAKMTVTKDNTYVGTTTVNGGTLEVQGRLSGTSGVSINAGATFLLNSSTNADNIVNPSADVVITSGTMRIDNSKTGTTQTYCNLTLSGTSTVDFGQGSTNKLTFQQLVTNLNTFGGTLSIWNWTGTVYATGAIADSGDATQDRLLFNTDGYGNGSTIANVLFYSDNGLNQLGNAAGQVQFGTQFEIVPVPEPTTAALLGSVALCALFGIRSRRRLARN
ncbi:MAG: autotransporter-associated beta strand repeat-containing protein, partial [Chthoniobacteraceae bacterium]